MTDVQADLGFGPGFARMKGVPDLFGEDGKPALSASTAAPVIVDEEAIAAPARSESRPAAASKPEAALADTAAIDHDARIAAAEQRLAALQSAPPPAAASVAAVEPGPKPRRFDFDDPDTYEEALVSWSAAAATHRTLAERDKQAGERAAAEHQERADQAVFALFDARKQKFAADHPDYAEVSEAESLPISTPMALTMLRAENGPAVVYWLGQHPDEAARIAGLSSPADAIYEIGKISARLSATPAPRPAAAASRSSRTTSAPAARAPREPTMAEYAQQRNEALAKERRGGRMFG